MHGLAAASIAVCGLPWSVKLAACAALAAHAAVRRPAAPMPMRRHADGSWSLPLVARGRLALGPGTAVGPFWARLVLAGGPRTVVVVLVVDQLGREDWRRLQAELRRRAGTGTV